MTDQDPHPKPAAQEPDVRLVLQSDAGRRTWAFYAQPDQATSDEADAGLSLLEVLALLRAGRRQMLLGALALAGLGAAYLLLAEPIYDVGAQVLVERRTVLANQDERPSGTSLFLATQAEVISSPSVIASALGALRQPPARSIGDAEDGVEAVAELVSATPIKGTNVIALEYLGPSPSEGVTILEAVIGSYRNFIREIDQADHRKDLELLAAREAELRQELDEQLARYARMHSDNDVLGAGPDGVSMHKSLLERLSSELVQARARRIELENERFALEQHGHLSRDRQESLSREELLEQLWRAEVAAAELRARYSERHPGLREANEQVAALRLELAKLQRRERAALEGEVEAVRSTEARLDEAYRREVARAKQIETRHFEQLQLKEQIDRLAQTHQSALATLRKAELTEQGLAEGRPMVAIHVLEPPTEPSSALWPRPVLVMAPCVAIGAALGLAAAWLAQHLRATGHEWAAHAAAARGAPTPGEPALPGTRRLSRAGAQWVGSGDAGSA